MEQTTPLYQKIVDWLFGHRYHAVILNAAGTDRCELSSFIFRTRKEADEYIREMQGNRSYTVIQRISFRSRRKYKSSERDYRFQ